MTEEELKSMEKETGQQDSFVFMREEIKARPLNRKKLARNTILAAISAVVFGIVACVTFALIAPFIMEKMGGTESEEDDVIPTVIMLPQETEEEEMNPEDMLVSSTEDIDYSVFAAAEEQELIDLINSITFSVSDYQNLYKSLGDIATNAKKSIVRVTPVKKSTDWLNYMYESASELSGLIVADSGTELFILTKYSSVRGNENILVSFNNNVSVKAELAGYDSDTDLAILSVPDEGINEVTKESIAVASLGSSYSSSLVGTPVIAVGSPMGVYDSVNYGMVTSCSGKINVTDNVYKQVVTNIYGSQAASGVVINLKGEVIGIIDTGHSTSDTRNIICAIGITELKRTLERLMNRTEIVRLGILGSDVPAEAVSMGTPDGIYVLSVEFDSPAMASGIQSGDIISSIDGSVFSRFSDLLNALKEIEVDSTKSVVIYRSVQDVYKEITIDVTFDSINK